MDKETCVRNAAPGLTAPAAQGNIAWQRPPTRPTNECYSAGEVPQTGHSPTRSFWRTAVAAKPVGPAARSSGRRSRMRRQQLNASIAQGGHDTVPDGALNKAVPLLLSAWGSRDQGWEHHPLPNTFANWGCALSTFRPPHAGRFLARNRRRNDSRGRL
jgi:hypothetical protein